MPSFGAHMLYDAPGGHQLFIGGEVGQIQGDIDNPGNAWIAGTGLTGSKSKVGWIVSAGANVNLADLATLTGHIAYSDGYACRIFGGGSCAWGEARFTPTSTSVRMRTGRAWGGYIGASFDATDTTSLNIQFGHANPSDRQSWMGGANWSHISTVHANIIWQPVRQLRMGWEIIYGRKKISKNFLANCALVASSGVCGNKRNEDALRGMFGAWFFF